MALLKLPVPGGGPPIEVIVVAVPREVAAGARRDLRELLGRTFVERTASPETAGREISVGSTDLEYLLQQIEEGLQVAARPTAFAT